MSEVLAERLPDEFIHEEIDIRDAEGVERIFAKHAGSIELIVHTAAQPSHDWAAKDPQTDFGVNANGTLNLLEAARAHAATPRSSSARPTRSTATRRTACRWRSTRSASSCPSDHEYYDGIPTTMSIDGSTHSLFGVSKAAADLLVQEYGRYFDMPTVCFRGGCLTGPNHAGTQLHGFLSYLMRCTITGQPYTVFGYGGKQVRDNIHSADLVARLRGLRRRRRARPRSTTSAAGARATARCSRRSRCARRSRAASSTGPTPRRTASATTAGGSPTSRAFERDYPEWSLRYSVEDILREIHDANVEHWARRREALGRHPGPQRGGGRSSRRCAG